MYFSFKFNFGNDPTVSAPVKGLCCKPTNIGKKYIMYFLDFLCTGFLSSFRRSFPSILFFQLIQIFFWDADAATSSLASVELIPWMLLAFSRDISTQGSTEPQETEWLERLATNVPCSSRIHMIRHNFHITQIKLYCFSSYKWASKITRKKLIYLHAPA